MRSYRRDPSNGEEIATSESTSAASPDVGRITVDPNLMTAKPVVRATRTPVSVILNLLAHGHAFERIAQDYPNLTVEDVRAAVLYVSQAMEGRMVREPAAAG